MLLQKRLYNPPSFGKNIGALHRRYFLKHPLFTTVLLFLTVSEVFNISNTDFLLNQVKKIFFAQGTLNPSFVSKHKLRPPSKKLLETFTFHQVFTSFHCG